MPWYESHENIQVGAFKRLAIRGLARVFRNKTVPRMVRTEEFEEYFQYRMTNDKLLFPLITYHTVNTMLDIQVEVRNDLDKIKIPVLLALSG